MIHVFIFINVLIYYTNLQLYFFDEGMTSFKPLYFYILSITIGILFIVFRNQPNVDIIDSKRPIIIWSALFIGLSTLSFVLISPGDDIALQSYIKILEAISLLVLFVILVGDESVLRIAVYAILTGIVISVFMNYVDFFKLLGASWKFSFVEGRAAGLFVNPNISGQQLVFGMVISVLILPKKYRWWLCLFVGTGVILTFSRGAILLWMIAILGLAWGNTFVIKRTVSVLSIGAAVTILTITLAAGNWIGVFKSIGLDSYLNDNTSSRIGESFLEQNDYSSKTRRYVAEKGISMFFDNPAIGYGVGATGQKATAISPHNMYIYIALQYGIIGLIMFLSLIWLLWEGNSYQAKIVAVLYAVGGMFSHNNLEQASVIVVLALVTANLVSLDNSSKQTL